MLQNYKISPFFLFFYFYGQNLSTRITKGNNKQVSILCLHIENKQKTPALVASGFSLRVGGDLLSHTDAVSSARQGLTSLFGMGRGAPLRNSRHFCLPEGPCGGGKGTAGTCTPSSQASDSRVPRASLRRMGVRPRPVSWGRRASSRAISAARLNASLRFHLRPIDVVVSHGPLRTPHLGASFALRCFQRLSPPDAATRRCVWRRNRCTVGPSGPVLSY